MCKEKLLSREEFNEQVFKRDNYKCVMCGEPAVDAHHILDRKLFKDGGYYLSNGSSVCSDCHYKCEKTTISVEEVREACGITEPMLPEGLKEGVVYDKWGNEVLENGFRNKGVLFNDDGVQKILKKAGLIYLFFH
jgi:hypothetical protein